jgi:glutamate/tyrosine decarboxylase-like PLP-dependent enzyme
LGDQALRRIPSDGDMRIDVDALAMAIWQDRAAGFRPACIIGTAGTVNTGAIDDLSALADLAEAEDLWFHVDGCIGALLAITPRHAHRVRGIARAHSVAFDPHKWLHAPFEAGCVLVRDAAQHRQAFAVNPEYLESKPRGLAAAPWLYEYGLQTSRGFRALKIWMALKEHGIDKFARLIDQNIAQGRYLGDRIAAEKRFELMARPCINIVCFRYRGEAMPKSEVKPTNMEIMLRLQEKGIAVLSDTTVRGQYWLRVAINNHRTRFADLDLLIAEVLRIGGQVEAEG